MNLQSALDLVKVIAEIIGIFSGSFAVVKVLLKLGSLFDKIGAGAAKAMERGLAALESQKDSQVQLVTMAVRQAAAAEISAKATESQAQLLPTLQKLQEQREEQSMVLRVISRQIREMRIGLHLDDPIEGVGDGKE